MAGIYIHIPFCKQACHYCNFHFSTTLQLKTKLLDAIVKEIEIRKNFFQSDMKKSYSIDTIYFGGGTPSILSRSEIEFILEKLRQHYDVSSTVEITLEANPDDLTKSYLTDLKEAGVNRLSIGIQSFDDDLLKYMNRAHTAEESWAAIQNSLTAGFESLNIDMIYGIPGLSTQQWETSLADLIRLPVNHLSCYGLTIEPKTALMDFIKKKKSAAPDDDLLVEQFMVASNFLEQNGFRHYEISNYALNDQFSKHNTAYWKGEPYLGLGPSAHSYQNNVRSWNIANNANYIKAIENNKSYFESENLAKTERFNEHIMTGLRTFWGINLDDIQQNFGAVYKNHLETQLHKIDPIHIKQMNDQTIKLSKTGWLWTDSILEQLFYD
ncbi:MAG: radical SAM family heme chaperone HemW [Chitinophagales bacterium]